eukprot:11820806-Karenia_brevis.AAC.1
MPLQDRDGQIWQPNPQAGLTILRKAIEDRRIQILWQEAALHRHGGGMEHGLDLSLTHRHYT